jgi:hypothetical protein
MKDCDFDPGAEALVLLDVVSNSHIQRMPKLAISLFQGKDQNFKGRCP